MRSIALLLNGTLIATLSVVLMDAEIRSDVDNWWIVAVSFAAPAVSIIALLVADEARPQLARHMRTIVFVSGLVLLPGVSDSASEYFSKLHRETKQEEAQEKHDQLQRDKDAAAPKCADRWVVAGPNGKDVLARCG